jgi:hypothetical protein
MNGVINLKEPAEPATRHGCGYLNAGFGNPAPIIASAYALLENVQFDTMVCFLYNAGCRYVPVNNCARWLEGVI